MDILADNDRGEAAPMMEPLLISQSAPERKVLTDLALELAAHSAGFRHSLPQGILTALAHLDRVMFIDNFSA